MPRRKTHIDWSTHPRVDAPSKMFDGVIGSTCAGGPDAPGHSSARCPVVSWAYPRQLWWVCSCTCHVEDLKDATLVAEIKQDYADRERRHREWAGW